MNELEATRAKLKCLEMVDGTRLNWWDVVKYDDMSYYYQPSFGDSITRYKFALGVVEGKPVWEGDELYDCLGIKLTFTIIDQFRNVNKPLSWTPPKHKTVMVELPIEEARNLSRYLNDGYNETRIAIKKALEQLK